MPNYDHEVHRMTNVNDAEQGRASEANDRRQRSAEGAYQAYALHCAGIDPSDGKPYSWPKCEDCGERTNDVSDTAYGVLCWECIEGQRQADADRAYDYAKEREMWEANDE